MIVWQQRRNLMEQRAGEMEPHVLPNAGSLILEEKEGGLASAGGAGAKAYGSF